jgi:hypothetical protein
MKLMFKPFSIGSGLVAGLLARRIFGVLWGLIDDEEPPKAEHEHVPLWKLVVALMLEGALFAVIRGLVDHGARHAFTRMSGEWPGEEEPEEE